MPTCHDACRNFGQRIGKHGWTITAPGRWSGGSGRAKVHATKDRLFVLYTDVKDGVDGTTWLLEAVRFGKNEVRGRWVQVHYDPHDLADVLIYRDGQRVQRALPQRPNERPQPRPERPTVTPPAFDYLGALRAEYDRRVVAEARRLSFAEWTPAPTFTLCGDGK